MQIVFVGGGNMATALIGGMLRQGFAADEISVMEPDAAKRDQLQQEFGVKTLASVPNSASFDVVLLAVKPQQMKAVAQEWAGVAAKALVISIAAGIRTDSLSGWLGGHQRIVRVMPNTPALVQAGVSGLFADSGVSAADRAAADKVLRTVGEVVWVDTEAKIDAVTAISGSGPAYVFYFIESLMQAGTELGFTPEQARQLAYGTFDGAVKLALNSQDDAATLRTKVTSKGGTTERALATMEAAGVKAAIISGAQAACQRGKELGDEFGKL